MVRQTNRTTVFTTEPCLYVLLALYVDLSPPWMATGKLPSRMRSYAEEKADADITKEPEEDGSCR